MKIEKKIFFSLLTKTFVNLHSGQVNVPTFFIQLSEFFPIILKEFRENNHRSKYCI